MASINQSGTFKLGNRVVQRVGYGAMQLSGPGVFGPPKSHETALTVLREAVANGVNHIDTSDYYGPHVTNKLIREALAHTHGRRAGVAAAPLGEHPVDSRHLVGRASSREHGRRSVDAVAADLGGIRRGRITHARMQ
jgi:aryl-alcohol dehydrogenase-like predicted oxidoreductase